MCDGSAGNVAAAMTERIRVVEERVVELWLQELGWLIAGD